MNVPSVAVVAPSPGPARGAGAALAQAQLRWEQPLCRATLEDEELSQLHLNVGVERKGLGAPSVTLASLARAWGQILTGDSPCAEPWLSTALSVGEGARCRGTIIAFFF